MYKNYQINQIAISSIHLFCFSYYPLRFSADGEEHAHGSKGHGYLRERTVEVCSRPGEYNIDLGFLQRLCLAHHSKIFQHLNDPYSFATYRIAV